jgi:hypothetical protein
MCSAGTDAVIRDGILAPETCSVKRSAVLSTSNADRSNCRNNPRSGILWRYLVPIPGRWQSTLDISDGGHRVSGIWSIWIPVSVMKKPIALMGFLREKSLYPYTRFLDFLNPHPRRRPAGSRRRSRSRKSRSRRPAPGSPRRASPPRRSFWQRRCRTPTARRSARGPAKSS